MCPIQTRGTSLADYSPAIPALSLVLIDLSADRSFSRPASGSRPSQTPSFAVKSGRLLDGPPPQQLPEGAGPFVPLNRLNAARPQETDRHLQSLTGLIVCISLPRL